MARCSSKLRASRNSTAAGSGTLARAREARGHAKLLAVSAQLPCMTCDRARAIVRGMWQLAQLNVARPLEPLDSPRLAEFVASSTR
jgi:hypothetical protein